MKNPYWILYYKYALYGYDDKSAAYCTYSTGMFSACSTREREKIHIFPTSQAKDKKRRM